MTDAEIEAEVERVFTIVKSSWAFSPEEATQVSLDYLHQIIQECEWAIEALEGDIAQTEYDVMGDDC